MKTPNKLFIVVYRGTDSSPSVDGESDVDEREEDDDSATGRKDSQLASADHQDMLGECELFQIFVDWWSSVIVFNQYSVLVTVDSSYPTAGPSGRAGSVSHSVRSDRDNDTCSKLFWIDLGSEVVLIYRGIDSFFVCIGDEEERYQRKLAQRIVAEHRCVVRSRRRIPGISLSLSWFFDE